MRKKVKKQGFIKKARQAHNLKVVGSNPAPATNFKARRRTGFLVSLNKANFVRDLQNPDVVQ